MTRTDGVCARASLWPGRTRVVLLAALTAVAIVTAGCAARPAPSAAPARSRLISVVASENFWGSIARQLGGSHAAVYSLISDPNADPHQFETSAGSARAVATADYVILNGAGYDDWLTKLMAASPNPHRTVLNIGAMLGKRPGDNPHLWYDPAYVTAAMNRIEADFKRLDPQDAGYFTTRRSATDAAFARVRAELAQIKGDYAGRPVAATESIVVYLARYLGLRLISPPAFMTAVSDGSEPPAASVAAFATLLASHRADVLVYNEQTATALTTRIRELATADHVPVVGFSETIQPPGESFQRWFGDQLTALHRALREGARR